MRRFRNFSNYSLGVQYDINNKNRLSVEYVGFSNDLGGTYESTNEILLEEERTNLIVNTQKGNLTFNNSISVNYSREIDSLGSSLFVGTQLSYYDSDTDDLIQEQLVELETESSRDIRNLVELNIPILAAQVDYSKYLSAQHQLNMGFRD